jgi:hypothetical protein
MSSLLLGHLLLGVLGVIGLVVTILLLRQVRHLSAGTPAFRTVLHWLPIIALIVMAGGVALAESSLLSIQGGQGVDGLGGFVIGTCLVIFADLCVALACISLREVLKTTRAADDLRALLSPLSSQESNATIAVEEE